MKLRELIQTEMRDRRDAYQRDYDSSVSGMGIDHDFRNRERNAGLEDEVNNIGIMINGRRWKIFRGEGPEGSQEWFDQRQRMKKMCARKTEQTGKQWTMFITGERPTAEGVAESASAGATSSANVATVVNPDYANNANNKPVKSVNALDQNSVSLFGAPMETMKNGSRKKAAIIKRR